MASRVSFPSSLRAGTTWSWSVRLPGYSGWDAVVAFRNAAAHFDVAGVADGEVFTFGATVAETAPRVAGIYQAFLFVSRSELIDDEPTVVERMELAAGSVTILPNVAASGAIDTRSTLRKVLDAIDAALLNRATSDQLDLISSQLDGRSITRDKGGLLELRAKVVIEIAREEAAGRSRAVHLRARFR